MKFIIERQGGFAGMRRRKELSASELSEDELGQLEAILSGGQASATQAGADRFVFHVAKEDEAESAEADVGETEFLHRLLKR